MSASRFDAAPVLETQRLRLHAHSLADFEDSASLWTDPEVTLFIGGRPSTPEEVWARVMRYIGHWAALGFGYWAVRERDSGRFIGEVGLANFKRELEPAFGDIPEIGWALRPFAQGRGYASEAIGAVTAWSDAALGPRTVCMIAPDNAASIRTAQRCGYRPYAEAVYRGEPARLFERGGGS